MRLWWQGGISVLLLASIALGQEPPPEQLRKMYDDALVQLKAAQDRKNELNGENERLKAKVAELEKQLAESSSRLKDLDAQSDQWAERSYFLRSHYAAWKQFLQHNPGLMTRWRLFLEADRAGSPFDPTQLRDPDWPLSAEG